MHPCDLDGGFSDLEMTWLLYCAGAATEYKLSAAAERKTKEIWCCNMFLIITVYNYTSCIVTL